MLKVLNNKFLSHFCFILLSSVFIFSHAFAKKSEVVTRDIFRVPVTVPEILIRGYDPIEDRSRSAAFLIITEILHNHNKSPDGKRKKYGHLVLNKFTVSTPEDTGLGWNSISFKLGDISTTPPTFYSGKVSYHTELRMYSGEKACVNFDVYFLRHIPEGIRNPHENKLFIMSCSPDLDHLYLEKI